jgi:hypothetical protein
MRRALRRYGFKDISKIVPIAQNPADVGRFSSEIAGLVGPTGLH